MILKQSSEEIFRLFNKIEILFSTGDAQTRHAWPMRSGWKFERLLLVLKHNLLIVRYIEPPLTRNSRKRHLDSYLAVAVFHCSLLGYVRISWPIDGYVEKSVVSIWRAKGAIKIFRIEHNLKVPTYPYSPQIFLYTQICSNILQIFHCWQLVVPMYTWVRTVGNHHFLLFAISLTRVPREREREFVNWIDDLLI